MRLSSTLFVLISTLLSAPLALATQHLHGRKVTPHTSTSDAHKKRKATKPIKSGTIKTASHKKTKAPLHENTLAGKENKLTASSKKKHPVIAISQRYKSSVAHLHPGNVKKTKETEEIATVKLSPAHKKRYQHAKQTAMIKLMKQVGKPYHFGGTSPSTGFDCSGLVYYAYKDVMRIKMPRTANEMFHLHEAAPIKKNQLETGDLVFFRINNHGAADHVGVYLGGGKFIQSPRSGEEIRVSYLSEDYWQNHYIGARRVMTPKTIR